jgi:hypothetical protein
MCERETKKERVSGWCWAVYVSVCVCVCEIDYACVCENHFNAYTHFKHARSQTRSYTHTLTHICIHTPIPECALDCISMRATSKGWFQQEMAPPSIPAAIC